MSDDGANVGGQRPASPSQHGAGPEAASAPPQPGAPAAPSSPGQHFAPPQSAPSAPAQHFAPPQSAPSAPAQHLAPPEAPASSAGAQHAAHPEASTRHVRKAVEASTKHGHVALKPLVVAVVAAVAAVAAIVIVVVSAKDDGARSDAVATTPTSTGSTLAAEPAVGEAFAGKVTPGDGTIIPFTADAGSASYFAAADDCVDSDLQWVVEDASGTPVTGGAVICDDVGRVAFSVGGQYRIRVYAAGPNSGEFSVFRRESRPDRSLTITAGETVEGNIDLPGAQDLYTFTVDAGTVAYFVSPACDNADLQWTIETAEGSPVSGGAVVCNDIGRVDFTAQGDYRVRVYSVFGATNTYSVTWRESRPDQTFEIASGQTVSGHIDLPGAQDLYEFDADAGDVAYFAASESCASNALYWTVESSAGTPAAPTSVICDDVGRVAFTATDHYRLRIYSVDGGVSDYSATWLTSRSDSHQPLVIGTPTSGEIDLPGSRDHWVFSGEAGDSIVLTADPGCDAITPLWVVQSAEGTPIAAAAPICSDLGRITLPADGEYEILVYDPTATTGAYAFTSSSG